MGKLCVVSKLYQTRTFGNKSDPQQPAAEAGFMSKEELLQLENRLFIKRLGLAQEQVQEAKSSLLGFFETLSRIDERLRQNPTN